MRKKSYEKNTETHHLSSATTAFLIPALNAMTERTRSRFHLTKPVSGFTLTELLVVIAVVGMLAALLLPALIRANEVARTAVRLGNLRQFSVAAAAYTADNQGSVPRFWEWLYATPGPALEHDVSTGTLFPYLKNKAVYLCPTDRLKLCSGAEAPTHTAMPKRDYSYAMNCVLCHQHDPSNFWFAKRICG
jgi:prepilin-type N-terminal cleavage/methylation domain-containing protein